MGEGDGIIAVVTIVIVVAWVWFLDQKLPYAVGMAEIKIKKKRKKKKMIKDIFFNKKGQCIHNILEFLIAFLSINTQRWDCYGELLMNIYKISIMQED